MGTRETAAVHLFPCSLPFYFWKHLEYHFTLRSVSDTLKGGGTLNVQLVHHHVSMPNSTLLYHTFDLIWRHNLQNESCDLLKNMKLRLIKGYEEVGSGLIFSCFKIYMYFSCFETRGVAPCW